MANRFEQVDELVGDAITVVLEQRSDGQWAKVFCPRSAHASLREDRMSDAVWKGEWGELYRSQEGDDEL
jgi:hypothetical protein